MAETWLHREPALVQFKLESAYGTDASPVAGTDDIYVNSISMQPGIAELDLTRVSKTYRRPGKAIGQTVWNIEVELPLAGPPDPSTDPLDECDWTKFLRCASHSYTESGGPPIDTAVIAPSSLDAQPSGTLYCHYFKDGASSGSNVELCKATGVRFGNCTLTVNGDGEAVWKFSGMGLYNKPTATTEPSGIDFLHPDDNTVPKGYTISIGGRDDNISTFTLEISNELVTRGALSGTHGVAGFKVVPGTVSLSVDPEFVLTTTFDRYQEVFDQVAGTPALSITIPTVFGGQHVLACDNLQRGAFTFEGDDTLRLAQTIYLRDNTDAGDDAFSWTITYP